MKTEQITNAISLGIKDYFKKNNFSKAVIGLSGGLDSSVSAFLTAKALGSKNLLGILMPDEEVTSNNSINDAVKVAKKLKIEHKTIPINEGIRFVEEKISKTGIRKTALATANTKARLRMAILYHIANSTNSLVIGTSDKSEIALGYTTKYGDNASDILVIGDLWKTQVKELGKSLGVPESILKKKPSAELISGINAETELGAPYEILDGILKAYIEEDLSSGEIIKNGFSKKTVENVIKRIQLNEHKRKSPVIIRLSERSFHTSEWRMPITNGYEER